MPHGTTEKQRTNITLSAARAEAWARENAGAIAERRDRIAANGPPLADLQIQKLD